MKKRIVCVIATLILCFLTACGSETGTEEETFSTLYIEKDGKVIGKIVEDFDEDYYNEDELKDMIQENVDVYNKETDGENITFKSCVKVDNVVSVKLSYKTADDYAAFNGNTLFVGTVQEAYQEGYTFDMKIVDPVMNSTVGKDEILNMGDSYVVITDENVHVSCFGDIQYVSDGTSITGDKVAFLPKTDTYSCVIFK